MLTRVSEIWKCYVPCQTNEGESVIENRHFQNLQEMSWANFLTYVEQAGTGVIFFSLRANKMEICRGLNVIVNVAWNLKVFEMSSFQPTKLSFLSKTLKLI